MFRALLYLHAVQTQEMLSSDYITTDLIKAMPVTVMYHVHHTYTETKTSCAHLFSVCGLISGP